MIHVKMYIVLNAVIVTFLVVYFLSLKKRKGPAKLNFKADKPLESLSVTPKEIPLNIVFNFNGHSFDAYEVLGVPAGSTMEEIQNAYQKVLATASDPSSKEFYRIALSAIQNATKVR